MLAVLLTALVGTLIYAAKLRRVAETAPRLAIPHDLKAGAIDATLAKPKVSVIIPAYNEAANIQDCLLSVLQGTDMPPEQLEVLVIDDQSTDETLAIVQMLQKELNDPRFNVLVGQLRPEQQTWMGKNWACTQAVARATGAFLLFIDADVRLKPGAIEVAIETVQHEHIDLLTLCPEIVCGCFSEWLIQPWLMSLLMAGFDLNEVNDPTTEAAFAAGMFMLFRRTAYEQVGGHQSVADQAVEDVELARRLKRQGLKLKYVVGSDWVAVRMYRSFAGVWEGWTKNWHLGSRRNVSLSLFSAVIMLWVCVLSWLGLGAVLYKGSTTGLNGLDLLSIAVALVAIGWQYRLRQLIEQVTAIPPRYWWLSGIGGALVAAIAFVSIIKTETGWGWTWRGRPLKLPDKNF